MGTHLLLYHYSRATTLPQPCQGLSHNRALRSPVKLPPWQERQRGASCSLPGEKQPPALLTRIAPALHAPKQPCGGREKKQES